MWCSSGGGGGDGGGGATLAGWEQIKPVFAPCESSFSFPSLVLLVSTVWEIRAPGVFKGH